jgi:hypothetical protein
MQGYSYSLAIIFLNFPIEIRQYGSLTSTCIVYMLRGNKTVKSVLLQ